MPEVLYRFRTIKGLIEWGELENQEIFFAAPEQLNDPMEGFKDMFWAGDSIVWNNLFKHYTLCLQNHCLLFLISGDVHDLGDSPIPVFANQNQPPSPDFADTYEEICTSLFKELPVNKASELLASRQTPVRRNELVQYLSIIHSEALRVIFRVFEKKKLVPERTQPDLPSLGDSLTKLIELADAASKEHEDSDHLIDAISAASRHVSHQMELISYYNAPESILDRNRLLLLSGFPSRYVQEIEQLAYPEWYTACFMSDCKNPSSWGYYGDGHKGACLIFDVTTEGTKKHLKLEGINGWGSKGATRGIRTHEFFPIKYDNKFIPIDFFRSLGRLPLPTLSKCWYTDEQGHISTCSDGIFGNEEQWREKYWKDFYQVITTKLEDWSKEKEYRLILSSSLSDFSTPEDRKLKYDFADLKGIVFGIKTPLEDKLKVMRVIDAKCQESGRKDFKFYQADYSPLNGCIEHNEMSLLKITP